MNNISDVFKDVEAYSCKLDEGCKGYWLYHKKRYQWFLSKLKALLEQNLITEKARILDIAPLYQTLLMNRYLPEATVDTIGYINGPFHPKFNSRHILYDLNDCYYEERYLNLKENDKYDLVVMLEVIEHLPTSLPQIFKFLHSLLKKNGILFIQTPNAVSLTKRIKMLTGINPFELIRENMREDPGHYREYTRNELCYFGDKGGFSVLQVYMENYFPSEPGLYKYVDTLSEYISTNLRTGISIIYKKNDCG